MNIGIITRNPNSWSSSNLIKAFESLGHSVLPFKFSDIIAYISQNGLKLLVKGIDIVESLSAVVVRPFGRVSLDQAIFRIDLLYALQDHGVAVFNKPSAIEKCVDKFRSLYLLKMYGVPVPETLVTERCSLALRAVDMFRFKDVVIKPMFGSRGHGSARVRDRDVLWEIIRSITFIRKTAYIQKFVPHKGVDIRVFVLGDRVLAAMYRIAPEGSWKTNIARGGKPSRIDKLDPLIEEVAVKAAKVLECDIAGVDIADTKEGIYVFEVNSQPGWRGLQEAFPEIDIAKEIAKYIVDKVKK
ncbi:MAG: RimK family alpha-L-glutamate ligase [Desulfurococcaceae archaeon]|nr:RimK family alpha-L-glutamate ligase [Desulfurococcaceae archaeon]